MRRVSLSVLSSLTASRKRLNNFPRCDRVCLVLNTFAKIALNKIPRLRYNIFNKLVYDPLRPYLPVTVRQRLRKFAVSQHLFNL